MPARVNPDVPSEARLLRAVGKRIRSLREKKGLTMAELGQSARGVVYFQQPRHRDHLVIHQDVGWHNAFRPSN